MIDEVKSGDAQLLDVRSLEEWQAGHADHALHIPVDELLQGKIDLLLPTKKIYVYCASGGRAGRAAHYLQEHGFNAENVGGLSDWLRASTSN
jgi:rhodanese-related sulfurtransferase